MLAIVVVARLILSFIVINFAAAAMSVVLPTDKLAVACCIFKSAVGGNVAASGVANYSSSSHTSTQTISKNSMAAFVGICICIGADRATQIPTWARTCH